MIARSKYTNAEIIAAYQQTGSVWEAGKLLGLAGQSVHERLRAIGYPMAARHWTEEETAELRELLGQVSLAEIANRLGRPYAGVAGKASALGVSGRRHREARLPRGAGYDKVSVARYVKQIEASGDRVTRFARRNGLGVELLCKALERHFPEWWHHYKRTHSDLEERACIYCDTPFIPTNAKQVLCSRACGAARRTDRDYFGGKRRNTIGLAEEQCQMCGRKKVKGLTPHHVLGKENDPENDYLIALCRGCHNLVTLLGGRPVVDDPAFWESLIQLAWLRKHGADEQPFGVSVYVDVETTPAEQDETDEDLICTMCDDVLPSDDFGEHLRLFHQEKVS